MPNGQVVSYGYDATGRRVSRTASGTATSFVYDGADVVLDRANNSNLAEYLNGSGLDEKLRQTTASNANYFLQDHLGTTIALISSGGATVESIRYEAFGKNSDAIVSRYGFTGREHDATTGLLYYRARWHDPERGSFMSEDPIGFKAGLNLYAYVGNNPINDSDPSGLAGKKVYSVTECFDSDPCPVLLTKMAGALKEVGRRFARDRKKILSLIAENQKWSKKERW